MRERRKFKIRQGQIWQSDHGDRVMVQRTKGTFAICLNSRGLLTEIFISKKGADHWLSGYKFEKDAKTLKELDESL